MSFAQRVKRELAQQAVKNVCCRKAQLYGLLCCCESEGKGLPIRVTYSDAEVAERAVAGISPLCNRQLDRETEQRGGHRYIHITFRSRSVERAWFRAPVTADVLGLSECMECTAHFLRGVFLAAGTVNDPQKSAHLELRIPNPERAELIMKILVDLGLAPGVVRRQGYTGLYYKKAGAIQDFLSVINASHAVFDVLNKQIEREIRNNENRATNCVTQNIQRSVKATERQLTAIRGLAERGLLPALPEDLQETAKLRLTYFNVSMAELAKKHSVPITKSGLNHRLAKIIEMYERIEETDSNG